MTERQSKKKEKEPVEKTHPKGCSCPKCLDRKISAIAVILQKEMEIINEGIIQLENELNQAKLIQKRIFDFLKEHHRAELLPDNSAIVKRSRWPWKRSKKPPEIRIIKVKGKRGPKKVVDPPAPDPEGDVKIYPALKPDKIVELPEPEGVATLRKGLDKVDDDEE